MARTFLGLVPHGAEWYSLTSSSRENSRALLDISLSPLCPFGIHWSLVSTGLQTPSLDNSQFSVSTLLKLIIRLFTLFEALGPLKKINRLAHDEQYNKPYFLQTGFYFPQLPMIYEKRYNTPSTNATIAWPCVWIGDSLWMGSKIESRVWNGWPISWQCNQTRIFQFPCISVDKEFFFLLIDGVKTGILSIQKQYQ